MHTDPKCIVSSEFSLNCHVNLWLALTLRNHKGTFSAGGYCKAALLCTEVAWFPLCVSVESK